MNRESLIALSMFMYVFTCRYCCLIHCMKSVPFYLCKLKITMIRNSLLLVQCNNLRYLLRGPFINTVLYSITLPKEAVVMNQCHNVIIMLYSLKHTYFFILIRDFRLIIINIYSHYTCKHIRAFH